MSSSLSNGAQCHSKGQPPILPLYKNQQAAINRKKGMIPAVRLIDEKGNILSLLLL
jgi:hypothetical protein